MHLVDLLARPCPPEPWAEGDNIPWHEPAFSARMLDEHLSQAHDAASRRAATIERQVAWLHDAVLRGRPTAILDLGCGPGLYTSRLARRGHTCVGIDYSPAAIAYARAEAAAGGLACRYRQADIRDAEYGAGFGLAMLIYGELNVFPPAAAARILAGLHRALAEGGALVLEPHTFDAVRRIGERAPSWYTAERGLFAEASHLVLTEHFWHAPARAATTRYFVVDLAGGAAARHAQSFQAYTDADYRELLQRCGFDNVAFFPSLMGEPDPSQRGLCAIVARKPRAGDDGTA
jgi:SAM-dependent methyltransferase